MKCVKLSAKSKKRIAFVYDQRQMPQFLVSAILNVNAYAQERNNIKITCIQHKLLPDPSTFKGKYDGILLLTNFEELDKRLSEAGLPMVTSDMDMPFGVAVDTDPAAIGSMSAEFFLRRKFTNFAIYASPSTWFGLVTDAFVAKVKAVGCDCTVWRTDRFASSRKNQGETSPENEWRDKIGLLKQWVLTLPHRCAVLCLNDCWASKLLSASLSAGRAVPNDIAVMGICNDIAYCSATSIPISSVEIDIHRKIYTSLQTLEYMIDHPGEEIKPNPILIPPVGIVERESTNIYPIDPPWLAKTLLLLDENIDKSVSVSVLAEAASVSPTTLQNAIHKAFGMSANKYILTVKMREAKRLMEMGKFSIKEIAARTGYASPSYFTRAYCAYYGHPPSVDCAVK